MCGQSGWRDTGLRRRGNICCEDQKMTDCNKVLFQWEKKDRIYKESFIFIVPSFWCSKSCLETRIVLKISYNTQSAYQFTANYQSKSIVQSDESSRSCGPIGGQCWLESYVINHYFHAHYCPPILGNNIITTIHCQQNSYFSLYMWRWSPRL